MISKIQKAQARVDKAVPDRYQVVALEGEGKQKKATVLDKEREVQFTYDLDSLVKRLRKDPSLIFGKTDEEDIEEVQQRINSIVSWYKVVRVLREEKYPRVHLTDLRCGTTFSYILNQFVSNLKKNPDRVFFSAKRGNVLSVRNNKDPLLFQAQERLKEAGGKNLKVISYDTETDKATILDEETEAIDSFSFKHLLSNLRRGTSSGRIESPLSKARIIETLTPGRFTIIEAFSDRLSGKTIVVIRDKETGVRYRNLLSYIKSALEKDPSYVFGRTQDEINDIRKSTNLERHGVEFPLQSDEIKEKMKRTLQEKYGVDNYSQTDDYVESFRRTSLDRYGVEHPMKSEEIRKRAISNSLEKYDGIHHTQHPDVVSKIRSTNQERYGVDTPLESKEIQEKALKSLEKNWGVTNPQLHPDIRERTFQTNVENGRFTLYEGKTVPQIADEIGSGIGYVRRLISRLGYEGAKPLFDQYEPGGSTLTRYTVSLFGDRDNLIVDRKLEGTSFRPDLCFPEAKVIVEADGLYWHSEGSKTESWNPNSTYHKRKLKAYEDEGYRALFFRSDEIYEKPEIVRSITLNALGENERRVFARKCSIQEISPDFFDRVHLMGKGSGRCYGLVLDGEVQAGIQVRWVKKKAKLLDVSRFATAPSTSVVGGWSRLIKHVSKVEKPHTIQTFIDRRYGTGAHLSSQGWVKRTEEPSFRWTDRIMSLHRMKFPGNTGYENGFFKIWDCGQAKWTLSLPSGHLDSN